MSQEPTSELDWKISSQPARSDQTVLKYFACLITRASTMKLCALDIWSNLYLNPKLSAVKEIKPYNFSHNTSSLACLFFCYSSFFKVYAAILSFINTCWNLKPASQWIHKFPKITLTLTFPTQSDTCDWLREIFLFFKGALSIHSKLQHLCLH